jgi:ComF family protein
MAHSFTAARAAGVYSGTLRKAIHEFKYGGHRMLAEPLGQLLYRYLTKDADFPWESADILVPVPIHSTRKRFRGYNQSELLANELSRLTGKPVVPDAIARCLRTRAQVDLSEEGRRVNMRNAFSVEKPELLKGKVVLLIDDVATTCSTAHECSLTLLKGNAARVYVACVAFDL